MFDNYQDLWNKLRHDVSYHKQSSGLELVYYKNCSCGGEVNCEYIISLIVKHGKKHYQHAHEWCCGHGAIGFELLHRGIADHLTLSDKFEPAIVSCQFTSAINNFKDRTSIFLINQFSELPEDQKYDLIVADPPWFRDLNDPNIPVDNVNDDGKRMIIDHNWEIHKNFFETVNTRLLPDGDIFLFENSSRVLEDCVDSLKNLQIVKIHSPTPGPCLIHIKKK
jgi:methylase of polypeptide subunit release factors